MKKYDILSSAFYAAAILLFGAMCAFVAGAYVDLWWGARYECWSAPASVAFLYTIPFGVGIAVCTFFGWKFGKTGKEKSHAG